jgi:hypothetical protein
LSPGTEARGQATETIGLRGPLLLPSLSRRGRPRQDP